MTSFEHKILLGGLSSHRIFLTSPRKWIYGDGQGTGRLPILWSTLDGIIITLMEKYQLREVFWSPGSDNEAFHNVEAFINYSTLVINKEDFRRKHFEWSTIETLESASTKVLQAYKWCLLNT